jgi:hypothetical protein
LQLALPSADYLHCGVINGEALSIGGMKKFAIAVRGFHQRGFGSCY